MRVLSPQFEETVYISEVNRARQVKSNEQVAINTNSDSVQKLSLRVAGKESAPAHFFQTSGIVRNESS